MGANKKMVFQIVVPILLFIAIAPFTPAIDIALSGYFYDAEAGQFPSHHFYDATFFYATYPAFFAFFSSIAVFALSYAFKPLQSWRKHALSLILTMAIGVFLITHVFFKDHWERPRPKQTENFGGSLPFRAFYEPDFSFKIGSHKSFPCGHCTMGFYFFALALIGRRLQKRWLFLLGMALALILGGLLSVARIVQGGHFFSDTLASALIMWLTALFCDWLTNTHKIATRLGNVDDYAP